ncbi:MAG: cache domain-containing protein, partial [Acetatifactor sp.]|nr:cache domain-containing protein [Acetatifactor sp.]
MRKCFGWLTRFDTIFNRLILSFVVIVVVVAAIADGFLIARFSTNYNAKIEKLKQNQMKDLEIEINQAFQEANRIIIEIATDGNKEEDVQRVLNKKLGDDFYKASKLLTYLGIVANQNENYVDSVEYYSLRNNLWISTNTGVVYTGGETEAVLSANEILGRFVDYQEYHRWMSQRMIRKGRVEMPVYSITAGYPLYTDDPEKFKGYIVINVSKTAVDKVLENNLSGSYDAVGIVDADGKLLLGAGDTKRLNGYIDEEKKVFADIFSQPGKEVVHKSKDYMLLVRKLDEGWMVLNLVSKKEFYDETRTVRMQCLSVSVLVIGIGLLLSYLFARKIYQPFYLIMNKLDQAKLNKKTRESEYYFIDRAIDELSMKAVANEEVLNQNIMTRMLLGSNQGDGGIAEKLQLIGYDEIYGNNYLLMIRLHQKIRESVEKETIDSIHRKILEFFYTYAEQNFFCIPVDLLNGNVCVFVSCKDDMGQMKQLRRKFNDYMSIHFMLTPIILQSMCFADIESVGEKYRELVKASQYIYFFPHTYFIDMKEIQGMFENPRQMLHTNFDRFTEALIARDIDAAEKIIKDFIETPEIFCYQVDELHGVILKYIFLYNYYLRDIMKEHKNTDSTQIY